MEQDPLYARVVNNTNMWHGPCLETVNDQAYYASAKLSNNILVRIGDCVLFKARDDSQSATLGRIKIFYEKSNLKYVSFWRLTPARLYKGLNISDAKELVTCSEAEEDLLANIVDKKQVISKAQYMSRGQSSESQMYHTSRLKLSDKIQLMKTHHKTQQTHYAQQVHESAVSAHDFQALYAFLSATSTPLQFSTWNKKRSAWLNMELIKQHHAHFVHALGKSLWEFTQAFEVSDKADVLNKYDIYSVLTTLQKLSALAVPEDSSRAVIHTPSWRLIREDEQCIESECSEDTSDEWYNALHDKTLVQIKERFNVLDDCS